MVYSDKEFIARKIKEYRKYAGLTQAQLADKIGISDKHICKIEKGAYAPSVETFLKLIETLKINIDEFGLNNENITQNKVKKEFVKLLYSIDEKELEFLYNNSISLLNGLKNFK